MSVRLVLLAACIATAVTAIAGCHVAPPLAPEPSPRAASSNPFVVHVELDVPLDRATAEDPAHYTVTTAAAPNAPVAVLSAAVIDTLTGRTVELVLPDGLPDSASCMVLVHDLRGVEGETLADRRVAFESGLSYRRQLRAVFADRCDRCHGESAPGGGYRTDSLAGLTGPGSDATANLLPGNPASLLIRRTAPARSMYDKANLTWLESQMIADWIVSYRARE